MFRNYLKIGFRNILKHKAYSFINIVGLAMGIACCSLIMLYIYDELSFDKFHTKADRIYRVIETRESPDQGLRHISMTAGPVKEALVQDFPEVIDVTRLIQIGRFTVQYENRQRFYEGEYYISDSNLFNIFEFELIQGDPETALSAPNTVVITEKTAEKYFGNEDPFGKTLKMERIGDATVTGVLKNPPHNSSLTFSMLIPIATMTQNERMKAYTEDWDSKFFYTYALMAENADIAALASKLDGFMTRYRGENPEENRQIYLQPLADTHLQSANIEFDDTNAVKGNTTYLYIFGAIAVFIAFIACINYMNLATARSFNRAKEVGMRKVVGAQRSQLIRQFLSEAVLVAVFALIFALALIQVLLPYFNGIAGKAIALDFSGNLNGFLAITGLALLAGILSGSYPALFLSGFRPAKVLKGEVTKGNQGSLLRQGLVVMQFVLSIIMIISTVVVYQQLNYLQEKQLGYNQDHLVIVDINSGNARSGFETMKSEFSASPSVKAVSTSSRIPGDWKGITEIETKPEGASDDQLYTEFHRCG